MSPPVRRDSPDALAEPRKPRGRPKKETGTLPIPPEGAKVYPVDLPAGGVLHLQSPDEVSLYEGSLKRYKEEYTFVKTNDLFTLGTLLLQQIILFRAQCAINGMEPEMDEYGVPTGNYRRISYETADLKNSHDLLQKASVEVRNLEKQLGIDKSSREKGNTHTVDSYLKTAKEAAHARGIHIAERTIEYERVINELKWKLRVLYNADKEDRAYHNLTPRTILDWLRDECVKFDEIDKKFAMQKGKVFVGKL